MPQYYAPGDWLRCVSEGNWDDAILLFKQGSGVSEWTPDTVREYILKLMPGYLALGRSDAGIAEELFNATSGSLTISHASEVMQAMQWAALRTQGYRFESVQFLAASGWGDHSADRLDTWLLSATGRQDVEREARAALERGESLDLFHEEVARAASELFFDVLTRRWALDTLKGSLAEYDSEEDKIMRALSEAMLAETSVQVPRRGRIGDVASGTPQRAKRSRGNNVSPFSPKELRDIKDANLACAKGFLSGVSLDFTVRVSSVGGSATRIFLFDDARLEQTVQDKLQSTATLNQGRIVIEKAGSASSKLARMVERRNLKSLAGVMTVYGIEESEFAGVKKLIRKFTNTDKEIVRR
ncbi:hypothetical protein [Streptomyces sp. NPDC051014]|uniref:hypothetical protein n=1 Tax=Streptomyces sp. NPDC051014 TaxID=3155751 RepID=UPI003400EC82